MNRELIFSARYSTRLATGPTNRPPPEPNEARPATRTYVYGATGARLRPTAIAGGLRAADGIVRLLRPSQCTIGTSLISFPSGEGKKNGKKKKQEKKKNP